jgi:hypothetical protein
MVEWRSLQVDAPVEQTRQARAHQLTSTAQQPGSRQKYQHCLLAIDRD